MDGVETAVFLELKPVSSPKACDRSGSSQELEIAGESKTQGHPLQIREQNPVGWQALHPDAKLMPHYTVTTQEEEENLEDRAGQAAQ